VTDAWLPQTDAPPTTGSLVFDAADRLLAGLLDRLGADLRSDDAAGFTLTRSTDAAPVGGVRVWRDDQIRAVVEVRIAEPARAIAATMLHGFAAPDSAAPHLVSDLAVLGNRVAVGLDLLPRVDPVVAPDWAAQVYPAIEPARLLFSDTPGQTALTAATARWRGLCSPWLIGGSVAVDRIADAEAATEAYLNQWVRLVAVPPDSPLDPDRDRRHLAALFDPATDEVWDALAELCGTAAIDRLRHLLIDG
jgi:hypothetical protein